MPADRDDLDKLAFDFFKLFSRFEYCLKATGYHKSYRKKSALADWDRYAKEPVMVAFFNANPNNCNDAIDYLLNFPPKKQVIKEGLLEWFDSPYRSKRTSQNIFLYIRRIRNNLFHGGKFNGRYFSPERSELLLTHSITILKACLEADRTIKEAYEG